MVRRPMATSDSAVKATIRLAYQDQRCPKPSPESPRRAQAASTTPAATRAAPAAAERHELGAASRSPGGRRPTARCHIPPARPRASPRQPECHRRSPEVIEEASHSSGQCPPREHSEPPGTWADGCLAATPAAWQERRRQCQSRVRRDHIQREQQSRLTRRLDPAL